MSFFHTLFLGALQGVTEFLPVSSSGHLALAQNLFGFDDPPLAFDVFLHFATMMSIFVYFLRDILELSKEWFLGLIDKSLRESSGWKYGWAVILGTFVTAIVALPIESVASRAFGVPWAVSCGLIVTASLLNWAGRIALSDKSINIWTGLIAGLAQGFAVMPGISRSGSTIVATLMTGAKREEAFRFSFLLSLPAIMGATLLEGTKVVKQQAVLPDGWFYACVLAFFCGLASLRFMKKIVIFGRWRFFSLYCLLTAGIGFVIGMF
ncbi:MAG: undecaprenyl-diphosphate phosphatase [Acetomicrobium sp.]